MIALAALSNHDAWAIALIIGLVVALAVAGLLLVLVRTVGDIRNSAGALLEVAGKVAGNTAEHPPARGDRARAGTDRGGGRDPGRVHERANRRIRQREQVTDDDAHHPQRRARGDRHRRARRGADQGPPGPRGDLSRPRDARRRAEHGGGRAPAAARARGQGDQRPVRRDPERACPGIAHKAKVVAERRPK